MVSIAMVSVAIAKYAPCSGRAFLHLSIYLSIYLCTVLERVRGECRRREYDLIELGHRRASEEWRGVALCLGQLAQCEEVTIHAVTWSGLGLGLGLG